METNLLDRMLDQYLAGRTPLSVTLQNKIRVTGRIRAFDSYVIVMDGPKREILYRHAITCLSPLAQEEQKRRPAPAAQPSAAARPAPSRAARTAPPKPKPSPAPMLSAAADEGINNSMKDGLLKWMRDQKAAK